MIILSRGCLDFPNAHGFFIFLEKVLVKSNQM